jgi:hypothetical protein
LNISGGYGHEFRRIRIPVIFGKIVDLACQRVIHKVVRILQRQREAGDDGTLRIIQFLCADGLIAHPLQFLDELRQSTVGHFGTDFGAGIPWARKLPGRE